jgi:hypothetical protein
MNYAVYMRRQQARISNVVGFQNGQDASQVTLKNQALAHQPRSAAVTSVANPSAVPTNFSQIGGPIGNIMEASQQNNTPTNAVCSSGYRSVASGLSNVDTAASLIGSAQACALRQFSSISSAPYTTTIPCGIFIDPLRYNPEPDSGWPTAAITNEPPPDRLTAGNKPGSVKCCTKDMSVLYTDNAELVRDQGRQSAIRQQYNLPTKLQGLRGPVAVGRG